MKGMINLGNYKGRITRIEKSQFTTCELIQGIKKKDQHKFDNSNEYNGSGGSYSSNHITEYYVDLYLTIYGDGNEPDKRVAIDIRDTILQSNQIKKISAKKLKQIQDNNVGKKVKFNIEDNKIIFDEGQLLL
jgi:hypothetical protein